MRGQEDFWRRFAVLAMLEAIGRVPVLGPLAKSAYHAYEETRPQLDLPGEALKTLQAMARDLAALLEAEGEKDLHRLDLALSTAIEALRRNGLTPQELAEHNLDPDRAAAETLRRSSELLRDLDETTQALSKRLVREYYRTLMEHPRVNEALAVPALAEGLQRLEELERRLDDLMALPRRRAWAALKPAAEKARLPDSPGLSVAILKAPYHFIPYTGRAYKSLRDELASWATQLEKFPYRTGVRIIYGPGGSGKTRLAVETARVLLGKGWNAYFIPGELDAARLQDYAPVWASASGPLLLIWDYVEHRSQEALRAVLQALASKRKSPDGRPPLAILLLMRPYPKDVPEVRETLGNLAGLSVEETAFWDEVVLPALRNPSPIPRLEEPGERHELFAASRKAFRERLKTHPETEVDYQPEKLPERPLAVIVLGLLAAAGHRVARSRDEREIFEELWESWEKPRWQGFLEREGLTTRRRELDLAVEFIERALVAASLGRPFCKPEEVAAFWRDCEPAQSCRLDVDALAELLPYLFPMPEEGAWRLSPIEPDPLADFVLARRLPGRPKIVSRALPTPDEIAAAFATLKALSEKISGGAAHTELLESLGEIPPALEFLALPMTVLNRLARLEDAPEGGEAARKGLEIFAGWLRTTADALSEDVAWSLLETLHRNLPAPDRTLALRAVQEPLYQVMVELAPDDAERAGALNMLGYALSALGRREEALEATQEAVELRRRLAQKNPDAFLPDLATSLNNLGAMLSALGRREEALEATQEPVELRRRLAQKNPDAFLPDLAMSLNNLGGDFSALGRREEALEATQEAAEIYRRLAQKNPDAFLPDLAGSLNNLGRDLSALGRGYAPGSGVNWGPFQE